LGTGRVSDEGSTRFASSSFRVIFDQVVSGVSEVDVESGESGDAQVAFMVVGNSSTRRKGSISGSFAHWGLVNFSGPVGALRAEIRFPDPTPEDAAKGDLSIRKADASLLHAYSQIFGAIKDALRDAIPGVSISTSGDPGPPPTPDFEFGQPPLATLPVLGSLGLDRRMFGPTGTTIISLKPNGAAAKAELKETKSPPNAQKGDVITKINGKPVGVSDNVPPESRDVIGRVLSTNTNRAVTLQILSQWGDNAGETFERVVQLDPIQ
jgi:hypothetical protein